MAKQPATGCFLDRCDRSAPSLAVFDHVIIADFLYVLEELERHYGSRIYHVFERNNYSVFTINGLAQAIANLCEEEADQTSCS